jgi:hypothetical protein
MSSFVIRGAIKVSNFPRHIVDAHSSGGLFGGK